jgi:hypothetical protein
VARRPEPVCQEQQQTLRLGRYLKIDSILKFAGVAYPTEVCGCHDKRLSTVRCKPDPPETTHLLDHPDVLSAVLDELEQAGVPEDISLVCPARKRIVDAFHGRKRRLDQFTRILGQFLNTQDVWLVDAKKIL